ncbi:hypothetical protein [Haloarchaeobius sp. DYHT-AS-18]|uniref:hypothetical protein n=1 Tax=Haloarchaeobius sp. DYHT-AS-18 TaxID=3446117 RepID=UPI003EBB19EE
MTGQGRCFSPVSTYNPREASRASGSRVCSGDDWHGRLQRRARPRDKDEVPRTVDLSLTNEYVQGATASVTVDPGSWSPISVEVPISGSFEATITVGEHTETVTWNTCPYSGGGIWLYVQDGELVILREN